MKFVVGIDTNTKLPLDMETIVQLKGFKTCLVCPSRWGRPMDIIKYRKQLKKLNFSLDATMTSLNNINNWTKNI
jgi:hypothetical protein